MKKVALVSVIAAALASQSAMAMNAKRAGQGFTDVMGDFTNAASNPALMTRYDQNDDFYFSLGIGVHAADQGEAIDAAEAIQGLVDSFNSDVANITSENIDTLRSNLEEVSQDTLFLREGIDFSIAIPNRYVSTALFVKQSGRLGVRADYDDGDIDYLNSFVDGTATAPYEESALNSAIDAAGYSVTDAGFAFGHDVDTQGIPFLSSLGLGVNLKYQRLDIASYRADMLSAFDEDEITDESHESGQGFNADIGTTLTFDKDKKWSASLAVRDLKENSVEAPDGTTFETDTRVVIGAGYQGELFSLVGQVDATEHGELGDILAPVKYASVGAEFDFWKQVQLRAGYRTDMNDVEEDVVTAGIGISPFDLFSTDIAAFAGSNNNVGVVAQIGLKF